MKKIILIIIILISSFTSVYSQFRDEYNSSNMIATEMAIKIESSNYSSWYKLNEPIRVYYNVNNHRMIIFSETVQVIDYGTLKSIQYYNHWYYTSVGTDSNYESILFHLYTYNSGTIIVKIEYPYKNLEYKYKLININ